MTDIKPLSERIEIIPRKKIEDSRGWFLKAITGKEQGLPEHTGEIYTVYSKDGSSRGGHYHKEATEWFTLLIGKSRLELKDVRTNELMTIDLDAEKPGTIVIPPYVAHRFDAINNIPFLVLAYTDKLYHSNDTIPLGI
ncbi:MAG: WxcM-like domain-containing protein [Candidatus Symbiothrix sp.]|jgi:dTDP-4-dehydrorhamnose 3,5-epimerase-like enzyme|nr:WxcM-like domain-containing protein [Candidatus Symbiothrix sp.]